MKDLHEAIDEALPDWNITVKSHKASAKRKEWLASAIIYEHKPDDSVSGSCCATRTEALVTLIEELKRGRLSRKEHAALDAIELPPVVKVEKRDNG